MIMNIQTLTTKDELNFEEEYALSLKSLHLSTDVDDYKVKVYGTIRKEGDLLILNGFADVDLRVFCDRCMEAFNFPLHAPMYDEFTTKEADGTEEEEIKRVTKSSIDMSDTILESIAMAMPMKFLCKENCKGMCRNCGANLNVTTCICEKADIDPRLEALKDIFCLNSKK